jgi:predicted RNase H-like HicB family nuclease
MPWELTAVYRAVEGGFAARVQEMPEPRAIGSNLSEARENLRAAVQQLITARRSAALPESAHALVSEETLVIT